MDKFLNPGVLIPLAVIIVALAMVAIVFILATKDRISGISISRSGAHMTTNDIIIWSETWDEIEGIDAKTRRRIRKATTESKIIDPEKYDLSAEATLVVWKANVPLVYSAYENHHTRELSVEGGIEAYLEDKTKDILESIKIWRKHFPELTDEAANAYACLWVKKILIPHLLRACIEKIAFYKSQIRRHDVSKQLKVIFETRVTNNEHYILHFEKFSGHLDTQIQSSIFNQAP